MDTISKALEMIIQELKKEFGEEATIEEGDEIVGVFSDGVISLSIGVEKDLKVNVVAGKPYLFDFNLNLLERK